ncbi:MAG: glycosyltransferase family 4 protein [Thermoplasmata archaeon]
MTRNRPEGKAKVLFVHPTMAPFIRADLELLAKHFELRVVDVGSVGRGALASLKAGLAIALGTLRCNLAFAWFAEKHAKWTVRLCKLFGRPSLVVVGGYEVARVPEIGYGSLLDPKKAATVRYVLENASLVLPVDGSLKEDAMRNLGVEGRNIRPLHTGHDPKRFRPSGRKENEVLTVGIVNRVTVRRKGLDVFVKAAALVPEARFVLVGGSDDGTLDELKATAPPNVEFAGSVPYDKLVAYYQRAKVYCQLSLYEGLPNALCEAMLCECVPVGTTVPGIVSAIGDTGFIVPPNDPVAAADAIRKALASDKGPAARARIAAEFSAAKRESELVSAIQALLR